MYEDRINRAVENFKKRIQLFAIGCCRLCRSLRNRRSDSIAHVGIVWRRNRTDAADVRHGMRNVHARRIGNRKHRPFRQVGERRQLCSRARTRRPIQSNQRFSHMRRTAWTEKDAPTPSMPEARTPDYYKRRPCLKMVETAATIFAEFLASRRQTPDK